MDTPSAQADSPSKHRSARRTCLTLGGWSAVIGLFALAGCVWLLSKLPPPPTPISPQAEGLRTLVEDSDFYGPPAWSPDGSTIAVTRGDACILSGFTLAECPGGSTAEGDFVLIDVKTGAPTVYFSRSENGDKASSPVIWLAGGKRVMWEQVNNSVASGYNKTVILDLETRAIQDSPCRCFPIATTHDEKEFLVGFARWDENRNFTGETELGWVNAETGEFRQEVVLTGDPDNDFVFFTLSPDNETILVNSRDGNIYKYTVGSGAQPTRLIETRASDVAWSPDGSKIVYATTDFGIRISQLMIANADGSSPTRLIEPLPLNMTSPAWSPDGTQIAFLYGIEGNYNAVLIADVPEHLRPISHALPKP